MSDIASSSVQSEEKTKRRPHRNMGIDSGRNRRMMANIQATLGGRVTQTGTNRNQIRKTEIEANFENVGEMLAKLKLANEDLGVSISDIRPYLISNAESFSYEDFEQIAESFCHSALSSFNLHFIVELCIPLIKYKDFQTAMSAKLDELISSYILDSEKGLDCLPILMAHILIAKWPRPYNRAINESNNILVSVISAVMGWINLINDQNEKLIETEQKTTDEYEASPDESVAMVTRCGYALCELCNTGQRGLWMGFPTLLDDIYEAIKGLIISELNISKSLRQALLQVYLSIFKWTASNTRSMISTSTQTITKPF